MRKILVVAVGALLGAGVVLVGACGLAATHADEPTVWANCGILAVRYPRLSEPAHFVVTAGGVTLEERDAALEFGDRYQLSIGGHRSYVWTVTMTSSATGQVLDQHSGSVTCPPAPTVPPTTIAAPPTTMPPSTTAPAPSTTVAPTTTVPCHEDDPCWDCATMGNHICGSSTTVATLPHAPRPTPRPVRHAPRARHAAAQLRFCPW